MGAKVGKREAVKSKDVPSKQLDSAFTTHFVQSLQCGNVAASGTDDIERLDEIIVFVINAGFVSCDYHHWVQSLGPFQRSFCSLNSKQKKKK
jgi:hypothetical protein